MPEESIQETPCYKLLRDQASQYVHGEKVAREELTRVQNELTQLQESRQQWQEELIVGFLGVLSRTFVDLFSDDYFQRGREFETNSLET